MLNGQTLKVCFLMIVGTLCLLLVSLTICAGLGRLPLENYTRLLGILGIPTLIGVIVQSFLHSNQYDNSKDKGEVKAP